MTIYISKGSSHALKNVYIGQTACVFFCFEAGPNCVHGLLLKYILNIFYFIITILYRVLLLFMFVNFGSTDGIVLTTYLMRFIFFFRT